MFPHHSSAAHPARRWTTVGVVLAAALGTASAIASPAQAADPAATISALSWLDENGNGLFEPDEGVSPGAIHLLVVTETATGTEVTRVDPRTAPKAGRVDIAGLKPDTSYTLTYTSSPELQFTHQNKGTPGISSAVDPQTGSLTVTTTTPWTTVRAGLTARRDQVTGRLFYDVNRNNLYDTGETPRPGETVTLDANTANPRTATTDAEGTYTFNLLASGTTHTLTVPNSPTHHLVAAKTGSDPTRWSSPNPDTATTTFTLPPLPTNTSTPATTITAHAGYANVNLQVIDVRNIDTPDAWTGRTSLVVVNTGRTAALPGATLTVSPTYFDSKPYKLVVNESPGLRCVGLRCQTTGLLAPQSKTTSLVFSYAVYARINGGKPSPTIKAVVTPAPGDVIETVPLGSEGAEFTDAADTPTDNDASVRTFPSRLEVRAFTDLNGDGIRNEQDLALAGLQATIDDSRSPLTPSQKKRLCLTWGICPAGSSGPDGIVDLPVAPDSANTLIATAPAGTRFSPQDKGNDDTLDSDVDGSGRFTLSTPALATIISDADGTRTTGDPTAGPIVVDIGIVPAPGAAPARPRLAETGADNVAPTTLFGFTLLVGGAGLLHIARRRRLGHSPSSDR